MRRVRYNVAASLDGYIAGDAAARIAELRAAHTRALTRLSEWNGRSALRCSVFLNEDVIHLHQS